MRGSLALGPPQASFANTSFAVATFTNTIHSQLLGRMVLAFVFLLFTPMRQASAQGVVEVRSLTANLSEKPPKTWSECVKWASIHSPEIKAANTALLAAQEQTKSAIGGYFPVIAASANYSRSENNTYFPGTPPGTLQNSDMDAYTAQINLTQNLFNGFGDQARIAEARANERSFIANLQIVKAKISSDLKTAFAGLMYARESLTLAEQILQRRKQNLSLVELRYEGGRENKGSVMLYKAYLRQAGFSKLQAVDLIDTAEATFGKVIGLEPEDVAAIAATPGTVPVSAVPIKVNFKSIIVDTPVHAQAVEVENTNREAITAARANLLPVLAFNGSAGVFDTSWFPQNNRWSIGVGLTVPILNGGKDYYNLKAAQANLYNASANLELADRLLVALLKQNYYNFVEAIEKEQVDITFLDAARIRATIGRNKYDNGLLTFEDWDLIETDLITRETNALQSQQNRIVQESNWEQAQGKGVIP